MMKRTILTTLLVLMLGGCSTVELISTAEATNALLRLRTDYDAASAALMAHIDTFREPQKSELLALKHRADALVADVSKAWATKDYMAMSMLDIWVAEGESIYAMGYALISEHYNELDSVTRAKLQILDADLKRVHQAIQDAKTNDYAQYANAALQLATLALRVASLL